MRIPPPEKMLGFRSTLAKGRPTVPPDLVGARTFTSRKRDMPGIPFPRLVAFGCQPWKAADEAHSTPHERTCRCSGERRPGAYCPGCTGYAPFDAALQGHAISAEARRIRTLEIARQWLGEGVSPADVASTLGLSEGEVADLDRELNAALEGRANGAYAFVPKGIKRLNRRDRRALAARAG
jgi:hypothetical protein